MKTFLAWAVCAGALACGGQTVGDLDAGGTDASKDSPIILVDGGGTCASSSDCPKGMMCGFLESEGCSAKVGQCFSTGPVCNSFSPGCACDGQTINIACTGLPSGYSTAPLAHSGGCTTAVDAGGAYTCGPEVCVIGKDVCYLPANVPDGGSCMPLGTCNDCGCVQAHFQCISTCKQVGAEFFVQCQ